MIPDHKLYFAEFDSATEANYVCGFLNSLPVRTWLGGFLLGKQIGTTIFEYMNVPAFEPNNDTFNSIADISELAHANRSGARNKSFLDERTEENLADYVRSVCTDDHAP